jgi:sec-independent protein translocase protein TatA
MADLFDRPSVLLIALVAVIVLFGSKRLPDAARGVGRSLRILKAETAGLTDGEGARTQPLEPSGSHSPGGPGYGPAEAPDAASDGTGRAPDTDRA